MRYQLFCCFVLGLATATVYITSDHTSKNDLGIGDMSNEDIQGCSVPTRCYRKAKTHEGKTGSLSHCSKGIGSELDQRYLTAPGQVRLMEQTCFFNWNTRTLERRGLGDSTAPRANPVHLRLGKNLNLPKARKTLRARTAVLPLGIDLLRDDPAFLAAEDRRKAPSPNRGSKRVDPKIPKQAQSPNKQS